jgi:heme A synthase
MLGLALWGLGAALFRRSVGGTYRAVYALSAMLFVLQALIGVTMVLTGLRPGDTLHYLYGILPMVTLSGAFVYSRKSSARREAVIFGVVALFTFGLVIRAWMSGHGGTM